MTRKTFKQKNDEAKREIAGLLEAVKKGKVSCRAQSTLKTLGKEKFSFLVAGFLQGVRFEANATDKQPPMREFWSDIYEAIFGKMKGIENAIRNTSRSDL